MIRRGARGIPVAVAAIAIAVIVIVRAVAHVAPLDALAPGAARPGDPAGIVREGAIDLPRGGPYLFHYRAAGPARLEIAGKPVPADRPLWIALPAGPTTIRYAGPADARLLWHPPGRRGALEYLPASSLAAAPPATARFSWSGAAPLDAGCATAIVAIAALTAAWMLRRRIARVDRIVRRGVLAVIAVSLSLSMIDVGDAGQTWDEDEYWSSGRNYVQNLLGGDFTADAWVWNYEHPPVTKYIAGVGGLWADGFGPARAGFALCLAIGCALLVPIGARLYGRRVGVAAGVFAALSPHLLAHGPIVGHEAPTVLWWSLALWLCLRAFDPVRAAADADAADDAADDADAAGALAPRVLAWRMVGIGVVLGLALMTRFVNGLLAPAIGGTLLAMAPAPLRRRTLGYGLAIIPAVAVATSIVLWPRLWSQPFGHLAESWAKLRGTHGQEWFLGAFTTEPSRAYFAIYLVATAPLLLLAASTGWFARLARGWRAPAERRAAIVVGLWLLAPLGVALSPVRQDGVRYVLPSLCALALMAAAAIDRVPVLARTGDPARRDRVQRALAIAISAAVALYLAIACLRVRPYYLDYYGEQVGGTAGVADARRFEVAWWGEGLADAIGYVNATAPDGARVYRECIEPQHLGWFRGDLWTPMVKDIGRAQWIVWYAPRTRPCPLPAGARLVYRVEGGGAPLAEVYRTD